MLHVSIINFVGVGQEAPVRLCLLFSLSKSYSMVYSAVIPNTAMVQVYASIKF